MRAQDNLTKLSAWAFRMRGGVWTALFFVILVLASPSWRSILYGLPLVLLGQLCRFWAVGCIKRYRGEQVGAQELATWGPYALVRNPLYTGNGLIGLGWGIMAGPWATAVFVVTFVILYTVLIVPYEEAFLTETFGDSYRAYQNSTGRFIPKSWPGAKLAGPFDWSVLWRSERYSLLTTVVGTLCIATKAALPYFSY